MYLFAGKLYKSRIGRISAIIQKYSYYRSTACVKTQQFKNLETYRSTSTRSSDRIIVGLKDYAFFSNCSCLPSNKHLTKAQDRSSGKNNRYLDHQKKSKNKHLSNNLPLIVQQIHNVNEYGEPVQDNKGDQNFKEEVIENDTAHMDQLHGLATKILDKQKEVQLPGFKNSVLSDTKSTQRVENVPLITDHRTGEGSKTIFEPTENYAFGGCDPSIAASNIPCPGCGAHLHCRDPEIPGFLPSEQYLKIPTQKLRDSYCQRCILMNEYNVALNVSVYPDEYRKILSQIKDKQALCLVVVDIMDPESSIFPGLMDLIGRRRPLYVVGNKIDLLPKDSTGYLQRSRDTLIDICKKKGLMSEAYVHHVTLVSAKTGYGIEELVTKMFVDWLRKGDIYILGCTNVGKSTLFNALLGSDYCKSTASDFISRATTCKWPGTTLNLLKFPVMNPAPWKLKLRAQRLLKDRSALQEEIKLNNNIAKADRRTQQKLIGNIGRTFTSQDSITMPTDMFGHQNATYTFNSKRGEFIETGRLKDTLPDVGFNAGLYKESRWCYDTPGVVNPEQIINILTQEELQLMLPSAVVIPKVYRLRPGYTMLITGLSRIDYVKGSANVLVTCFANSNVPIHVLTHSEAEDLYRKELGKQGGALVVPVGDWERIGRLPSLIGREFNFVGVGLKQSVADIRLSSVGFVSVTAEDGEEFTLRGYTPGGYGLGVRRPSLLPDAVQLRRKRGRYSDKYSMKKLKPIKYEQDYKIKQKDRFF